jgi:hypothetical protein
MSLIELIRTPQYNPLDAVESLAMLREWDYERISEDEVTLTVAGTGADYQVSFTWMGELEALHLACAFDLKVPERRRSEVTELVAMVNEQLWVGHFDLWANDGLMMFRHALLLTGGIEASGAQCESLLSTAVEACERYYEAFQFVIWAGKSARSALESNMFETVGEA